MREKNAELEESTVEKQMDGGDDSAKKKRRIWQRNGNAGKTQHKSAKEIVHEQQKWVSRVFFFVLAAFIIFPFVVLLHRVFPVTGWVVPAIAGVVCTSALFYLFRKIKFTIWTIIGLSIITLTITSAIGIYSFNDIYYDYSGFLYNISNEKKSLKEVFLR